ncbi:MAG: histidinol-phosphate transaminase [Gammaproteobacteria bacterium]|nr:histidinol-phosphate transaminase [Gammaproteobacteria bacterium]
MRTAPNFARLAARGVRALTPYVPGKPAEELEREYGVRHALKLASNENPLGPSPLAIEAARAVLAEVALYPDGSGFRLRRALADQLNVEAGQITLGNGSNDLLVLLAEAFLTPRTEAVFSQFGFLVYGLAVAATGARARMAPGLPAGHAQPYGHDLDAMRAMVGPRTRLVYVANPNNPTGTWLEADALQSFIASLPPRVIVVLDEAYCEYVEEPGYPKALSWLAVYPNLVVTRTFSKIHGLAGLRVGYAISHPRVAELLNRVRQPFNVNALGQAAALASLADADHMARSRTINRHGLRQLRDGFVANGLRSSPSVANFVLVDCGRAAAGVYEHMLRAGVIVRPVANYGLPRHLRFTVGLSDQNTRALDALRAALVATEGDT